MANATITVRTRGVWCATFILRAAGVLVRIHLPLGMWAARQAFFWLKVEVGRKPRWQFIRVGQRLVREEVR